MDIAIVVAVGMLATVAFVVSAPVTFAFVVTRAERVQATWQIRLLYGVVRVGGRSRTTAKRARVNRSKKRERPGRERSRKGSFSRVVRVLRTPGLVARTAGLARDVARQVRVDGAYAHGTVGLDDPADTGELFGALTPLLATAWSAGWDVRCSPDFHRVGVRGECGGRIWARPISVMWTGLRFIFSRPVLRAVRGLWRHRGS